MIDLEDYNAIRSELDEQNASVADFVDRLAIDEGILVPLHDARVYWLSQLLTFGREDPGFDPTLDMLVTLVDAGILSSFVAESLILRHCDEVGIPRR